MKSLRCKSYFHENLSNAIYLILCIIRVINLFEFAVHATDNRDLHHIFEMFVGRKYRYNRKVYLFLSLSKEKVFEKVVKSQMQHRIRIKN